MKQNADVVLCVDQHFWRHAVTTARSIAEANYSLTITCHIFHDRFVQLDRAPFLDIANNCTGIGFRFVCVDLEWFSDLPPPPPPITYATYLRFLVPDLLPPSCKRAIYLDTDLIVLRDLGPLWNIEMEGYAIAATPDPYWEFLQASLTAIDFSGDARYFNAGVLLMNLEYLRANESVSKLKAYIRENEKRLIYPDQDAMNAVLGDRTLPLNYVWNFQARMADLDPSRLGMTWREFVQLRKRPGVVHFTGRHKPWLVDSPVHYRALYLRFAEQNLFVATDCASFPQRLYSCIKSAWIAFKWTFPRTAYYARTIRGLVFGPRLA